MLREMRRGAFASGVKLFDIGDDGQGIVHVAAPEMGLTLPGATVVCPDSHTCTHGALGALAIAIGSSEVAHVLATQTLRQKKPKTMRIRLEGRRAPGVSAKDVILSTIGQLGTAVGRGHALEFAGSLVDELTIEERLTVCNLSIELGSKTGIMAPDETTYEYLAGRPYAPKGALFDKAVAHWRKLPSDEDAAFDAEHTIHVPEYRTADYLGHQPAGRDRRHGAHSRSVQRSQCRAPQEHGGGAPIYGVAAGRRD